MDKLLNHELHLFNREQLELTGINDVKNFDEGQIELITDDNIIIIQGSSLHIKKLSIETKEAIILGNISSIIYIDDTSAPQKSIFSRFFK